VYVIEAATVISLGYFKVLPHSQFRLVV